ncbi:MAG TPA: UvrD-helicase domain-containing protein [Longimicrobiaceae bacterium]|nr:UvrD-helicase domain-containing protein [Longimicrobiaceae bacterium]
MAVDLSHLNPEQREAATHVEGPLLVLAGAGSGKTRVLTHRIAYLVDECGVDPQHVLALTFTNKAAGEMRERVRALLGGEPAGMWVGTFHAVGARILRRDAPRLGWTPGFSVYDADDAENVVKRILRDELRVDLKRVTPRAVHAAISHARNELTTPEEYARGAADPFAHVVAEVYPRYLGALKAANAFDFDDLLVKPVELLRTVPPVLARYRARFTFLLVDEYQDTNRAQYVFLRLLAEEHRNLFVVGDDDQSIYRWRGADLRNILGFEEDFPDARAVRLEQNYRSTRVILDAANRVIAENVGRKGKTLRTERDGGELLTLVEAADADDEAAWVAEEIRARTQDDARLVLRDFVILYRTNSQSRTMEEALRRKGMAYRVIGGTRFYERREVKDALAYLRLVANPNADEAFLRIVNVPRRGIGDASVARLAEHASRRGLSLLRAAAEADRVDGIRGPAARALPELAALVEKHAALAGRDLALQELLRGLVRESGMVEALKEEGPEGEDRIQNLDELIAGAADLQRRLDEQDPELMLELEEMGDAPPRALDLFLAHVALVADIDQHDPTADAVAMMTLHNAKGLEFPFVFITGLEDGLFPIMRAYDERADMEEERRLFYVGITRAERKLYLAWAKRRRRGAMWMDTAPSPFLESVPPELVERRRTARTLEYASSFRQPWKAAASLFRSRSERLGFGTAARAAVDAGGDGDGGYTVDYSDSQDAPSMIKGSRVRHPQFGAGTVRELSGGGNDVRATIDFDTVGRKTVILRYANLQREYD